MFCWPCIVVYQYSKTNEMHFFIQLIMNQRPLYVSSTTCSFSVGAAQKTIGIFRAYCVGWLLPGLVAANRRNAYAKYQFIVCAALVLLCWFTRCLLCVECFVRISEQWLCCIRHSLIGFYNRDDKCLQRGTDWYLILTDYDHFCRRIKFK
jgi:hypothetical protein